MCVVSYVSRDFVDRTWLGVDPYRSLPGGVEVLIPVGRKEFEDLKGQVEQLKLELQKARAEDIRNQNPDCEMDNKVEFLRTIAKALGVDLGNVFEGHK